MKKTSAILCAFILLLAIMAISCSKGKNPVAPPDEETYTVTGIIREGDSGLAGVSVRITKGSGNDQSKDQTTITDLNGAYAFSGLANGDYAIIPSKTGYIFNPPGMGVIISGFDKVAGIIIAIKAGDGYTVTGVIQIGSSGLAGVSVRLTGSGVDQTVITDLNGVYAFSGLVNGTYAITPTKSDYAFKPASAMVTISGSDRIVDITATKMAYTVTGIICEGDSGLAGVSVRITKGSGNDQSKDQTTITDLNGAYAFSGLANGDYAIIPSKTGYIFNPPGMGVIISGFDKIADTIIATKSGNEPHEIPNITFVSIPGGTFQMGDVEAGVGSEAKPVHTVTLSSFEMSIYEVTNAQFAKYLNEALSSWDVTATSLSVKGTKGAYSGQIYIGLIGMTAYSDARCWITFSDNSFSVVSGHENWPVVWVTWYGAKAFALYYGLDLPTEAEWEYACRGGRQYKYGTNDGTISSTKANYRTGIDWAGDIDHPVDVGSYPGNPFGLYDMSGNVWEWCHDWYGRYYSTSETNPTGALSGYCRVARGGGWYGYSMPCQSAFRSNNLDGNGFYPDSIFFDVGFRVVRRPGGISY